MMKTPFSWKEYVYSFLVLALLGALPGIMYGANIFAYFFPYGFFYIVYWAIIALVFTYLTTYQRRKSLEEPMLVLSDATQKVASGDFSVFLKPNVSLDQTNYINQMFIDFNQMVQALGSLETMKTDFIANVSHEIKTPLTNIQGYVQMLQDPKITDDDRILYLTSLRNASKNLSELVTNMLQLSKLENQGIIASKEQFNVCEQLRDVIVSHVDTWEAKGIDYTIDIEDVVTLHADPTLVNIIWRNIIANATKFTDRGQSIVITQTSSHETMTVTIRDTGIGMDALTQQHVFEKFYQGDASRSQIGNGLGLSLVQECVELLGGAIKVESELGRGTTFTVILNTDTAIII